MMSPSLDTVADLRATYERLRIPTTPAAFTALPDDAPPTRRRLSLVWRRDRRHIAQVGRRLLLSH